jgi:hypothetical protein
LNILIKALFLKFFLEEQQHLVEMHDHNLSVGDLVCESAASVSSRLTRLVDSLMAFFNILSKPIFVHSELASYEVCILFANHHEVNAPLRIESSD